MHFLWCVLERKNQGLFKYRVRKECYKYHICLNELKNYLYTQYYWNYPYLEFFCLVIQVGLREINDIFGLPGASVTWNSRRTSTQRPFCSHGGGVHKKNETLILRSLPPSLICAICCCFLLPRNKGITCYCVILFTLDQCSGANTIKVVFILLSLHVNVHSVWLHILNYQWGLTVHMSDFFDLYHIWY